MRQRLTPQGCRGGHELAGKYSKRKLRRLWSFVLIVVACLAALATVAAFHSGSIGSGFDYLAAAASCVAVVLAFTWPVRCRVITARRRECRNEAYGVLFGCHVRGHGFGKFFARLGLRREPERPKVVSRQQPAAASHWTPADALPIVITVAGGGAGICAFWFGLITTAAGVVSVVLAAAQLH